MGLLDRLRFASTVASRQGSDEPARKTFAANPIVDWSSLDPAIFGIESYTGPLTPESRVPRNLAIQVGAVKRARDLIAGVIGTLPLYALDSENVRHERPLLEQPEINIPRSVTVARTIEDMLFEERAWWRIIERDWMNRPTKVVRLEPTSVTVRKDQRVYVNSAGVNQGTSYEYVEDKDLILFHSPNDALLTAGARAIRTALKLDAAAQRYADEPMMQGYFTPADGADPVDDDEVENLLENWRLARQARATGYVPAALKYNSVNAWSPADMQLVDARNHAVAEIARIVGLDPGDLGTPVSSDTYKNVVDRRMGLQDFTFAPYAVAFVETLSMDRVTPRGYKVRFDFSGFTRSDEKSRMETYVLAAKAGAYGPEEVRRREELPVPLDLDPPAPAEPPAPVEQAPADPQEQPMPQQNAIDGVHAQFADTDARLTLDFDHVATRGSFAADATARTITGVMIPWGGIAQKGGRKYRFARGSVKWSDLGRIKLLRDHDYSQAVGKAIRIEDTEAGLVGTFRVGRGRAGDEVLALAEDEVLDGFSVGVDFLPSDTMPDPENRGVTLVKRAALRENSILANPAFDDARLTSVAASADDGRTDTMPDATTEPQAPAAPAAAQAVDFSSLADAIKGAITEGFAATRPQAPEAPLAGGLRLSVDEPVAYRFDRGGNFDPECDHIFSADLHAMFSAQDADGTRTEAGKRVMGLVREAFATVVGSNVSTLNPAIQRPDMYVDQKDYVTPAWSIVNKGAPPNGVQPFTFPKYNSSSALVADHTEGTEPVGGAFTTTSQTVTPTALSGKASVAREVWEMGGNPAVSGLIFNQMRRGWFEGLETATATFLNTLTAAADINLGVAATDAAFVAAWEAALADLQFVRTYDFSALVLEKETYKKFAAAKDTQNRPFYPILNPTNANGTSASRFRTLDLAGVLGIPSWALPSTAGTANNSWFFDPSVVHGWASAPQRLEFAGTNSTGGYAPVAMVDIAIWGYKAFANTDIAGVRQVIYDTV